MLDAVSGTGLFTFALEFVNLYPQEQGSWKDVTCVVGPTHPAPGCGALNR